jgi:RNA polymerase sigma-70 factor (ECF subfamily)
MDQPTVSDEALLEQFVRGGRTALGALAARYEAGLLGLAQGMLGGRRDLACDAVQETWVRVIRFADGFQGRSSFRTWVYRILVNQCRTMGAAGGAESSPDVLERLTAGKGSAVMTGREGGAAGSGGAGEEPLADLRRAMEKLDDDKREVLLVCYHAGMTHEIAAEVLGIPLGTIKSRLHAALKELRETLAAETAA